MPLVCLRKERLTGLCIRFGLKTKLKLDQDAFGKQHFYEIVRSHIFRLMLNDREHVVSNAFIAYC